MAACPPRPPPRPPPRDPPSRPRALPPRATSAKSLRRPPCPPPRPAPLPVNRLKKPPRDISPAQSSVGLHASPARLSRDFLYHSNTRVSSVCSEPPPVCSEPSLPMSSFESDSQDDSASSGESYDIEPSYSARSAPPATWPGMHWQAPFATLRARRVARQMRALGECTEEGTSADTTAHSSPAAGKRSLTKINERRDVSTCEGRERSAREEQQKSPCDSDETVKSEGQSKGIESITIFHSIVPMGTKRAEKPPSYLCEVFGRGPRLRLHEMSTEKRNETIFRDLTPQPTARDRLSCALRSYLCKTRFKNRRPSVDTLSHIPTDLCGTQWQWEDVPIHCCLKATPPTWVVGFRLPPPPEISVGVDEMRWSWWSLPNESAREQAFAELVSAGCETIRVDVSTGRAEKGKNGKKRSGALSPEQKRFIEENADHNDLDKFVIIRNWLKGSDFRWDKVVAFSHLTPLPIAAPRFVIGFKAPTSVSAPPTPIRVKAILARSGVGSKFVENQATFQSLTEASQPNPSDPTMSWFKFNKPMARRHFARYLRTARVSFVYVDVDPRSVLF
eukprot:50875_1